MHGSDITKLRYFVGRQWYVYIYSSTFFAFYFVQLRILLMILFSFLPSCYYLGQRLQNVLATNVEVKNLRKGLSIIYIRVLKLHLLSPNTHIWTHPNCVCSFLYCCRLQGLKHYAHTLDWHALLNVKYDPRKRKKCFTSLSHQSVMPLYI